MSRNRPLIAFFDYPDVFEDFYPHYGVDQYSFATRWADTANFAFVSLLQREIGDVIWYVFSVAPELSEARHEVAGCRVKFLPSSWLHRCLWRSFYLPRAAWRWRRAYPAYATVASYIALASWPFFRALGRDRPDLFFVQDYSSGRFDTLLLIARVLGVPIIARHSGSRPEEYLGRILKRWTIPRADWLFVSGRDEFELMTRHYGVPRDRLEIIRPPVDTIAFRPLDRAAACRTAGLDPGRRYLLFVGRLEDGMKRVSAFIRAFATLAVQHPDADLVIAGDGPDRQRLQDLAVQLSLGRIHFLGWISGAAVKAPLYNAAEYLVLLSWRGEAFPAVVAESMLCGTPVLSSRVGGIGDLVIEDQTGWLFEPDDDEALAARLSFVLTHPEVAVSMRPRVRSVAEACVSPAVVASALRKCFAIVGGRHVRKLSWWGPCSRR